MVLGFGGFVGDGFVGLLCLGVGVVGVFILVCWWFG